MPIPVRPFPAGAIRRLDCQEPSHEELLESLTVTLREALEMNREDALAAAGGGYQEAKIAV